MRFKEIRGVCEMKDGERRKLYVHPDLKVQKNRLDGAT